MAVGSARGEDRDILTTQSATSDAHQQGPAPARADRPGMDPAQAGPQKS